LDTPSASKIIATMAIVQERITATAYPDAPNIN
jgi:hypothetical protein